MRQLSRQDLPESDHPALEMLDLGWQVRPQAQAPDSGYQVGAVVKDQHGNLHKGVNVENDAWTGSHAEYGAISAMFAATPRGSRINSVAIVTENGGPPCGNCRQHIWQFCGGNTDVLIYCEDLHGNIKVFTIGELLPFAFGLKA